MLRILPLGDSITQGDRNHNSYRAALWHMLQKQGHKVDFVGSLNKNYFGGPPDLQFDMDHEGHWGWRADEIINGGFSSGGLSDFLEHYTPDIVLLHLGTNDVFQGQSIASTAAELKTIVNILRADNPNVTILIAKLIPTTSPTINHIIENLNNEIVKIAAEATLQESKIVVVDHFSTFDPAAYTYDGVHPNARGERKMAETWFEALEELIKR